MHLLISFFEVLFTRTRNLKVGMYSMRIGLDFPYLRMSLVRAITFGNPPTTHDDDYEDEEN